MSAKTLFLLSSHHGMSYPNGYTDALSVFAGKTGFYLLRDRFGVLNNHSPYRLYEPHIPMFRSDCTKEFSDIMDKRAEELIALSIRENKILYVFLSGGVDSTALTIALLKASNGDYKNIHIVYTKYSVEEYPLFFEYLEKTGITLQMASPGRALDEAHAKATQEGFAVSGWCADQLFGSQINHNYQGWYFKDWRPWIGFDDAVQQLEEAFKIYGLPIRTFGEFAWFMNFSCKYDFVKYTDVMLTGKITGCMIPFYDTEDFNSWSVSNFDILHLHPQQETEHYKKQLKDYIFSFNKDTAYYKNKGKIGSWGLKNSSDDKELWKYPLNIIAMETPTTVRIESYGTEMNDSDENFIMLRDSITKSVLLEYKK